MARISTTIDNETMLKLTRRAERMGISANDAVKIIASKGVGYFLRQMVGATKSTK